MSTKAKKATKQGLRYSEAKKREVVNFVNQYNKKNGRGGQAAAVKKYGIAVLSISNWLKNAAESAPVAAPAKPAKVAKAAKPAKAAKAVKPAKAAKAAPVKGSTPGKFITRNSKVPQGTRYTPEAKQTVVDFVKDFNATNGRGGMTAAARKFGITPLTITAWVNRLGGKTPPAASAAALIKKVAQLEAQVASLQAKLARKK